jgi:uncharacterized protein with FMN-binding domain
VPATATTTTTTTTTSTTSVTTTAVPGTTGTTTGSAPSTLPQAQVTCVVRSAHFRYGYIDVAVTGAGGRVLDVSVPEGRALGPWSQVVSPKAVPVLENEAPAPRGMNLGAVSGATFTSDAFARSLQSAVQGCCWRGWDARHRWRY